MSLGKTLKEVAVRVTTIPTTTPPFGLGYKPTDGDLLELELRKMARTKTKAKALASPLEPLKLYTFTLNEKFVKVRDS